MRQRSFFKIKKYLSAILSNSRESGLVTNIKLKVSIQLSVGSLRRNLPKMKQQNLDIYILDVLTAYYYVQAAKSARIELTVYSDGEEDETVVEIFNDGEEDGADENWLEFVKGRVKLDKLKLAKRAEIYKGFHGDETIDSNELEDKGWIEFAQKTKQEE
jgi:hypothetical protein